MAIANGPATASRPTIPSPTRDNRPLVLVVDDEESYRQALASGLTREGFTVESAGDGHEALRLFHRVHPLSPGSPFYPNQIRHRPAPRYARCQ